MTNPVTVNGKCSNCGSTSLTLAQDLTEYMPCEYDEVAQRWNTTYSDLQNSSAEDAVRFFCSDCGTQHQVPEDL